MEGKIGVILVAITLMALMQMGQEAYGLTNGRAYVVDIVAKPGQKARFDILLNYTATQSLSSITYALDVWNLPSNWVARIYYNGQEMRSISLANKEVVLVDLEIEIPDTAKPGRYPITFSAMGKELATEGFVLEISVTVEALKREIRLTTEYPDVTIEREGTATFEVVLNNVGETDELANLTAEAPDGWRVTFKGQPGGIFGVSLPKGQSTIIHVDAKPPEGAPTGIYDINVRAKSADQVANSTLVLRVAVVKTGISERMLSTAYPELTVEAGKVIIFPLTIRNLGTGSLTYRLSSVSVPDGWTLSFRTSPEDRTSSVSSVFLGADESANLYLTADPPATITIGNYSFTIRVTSEEGASQDLKVAAKVTGSYELTLDLNTLFVRGRGGETAAVQATTYNTGATRLTNVSLEVTAPEGWGVIKTPNFIEAIAPGEYGTIVLMLKPPSDAEVGDYLIGVRGLSDKAKSTQLMLRVNVQSASLGLWVIGIISIIIAAAVIAIVYFKFLRK
jgi:uncharacterized membrane protein